MGNQEGRSTRAASNRPNQIWVILSTRIEGGGAELQARWEWEMLRKHGIPAFLLTFEPTAADREKNVPYHQNIRGPGSAFGRRLYENITSISLARRAEHAIRDAVQKMASDKISPESSSPDSSDPSQLILHLHNVTRAYGSICLAVRNIRRTWPDCRILETIHDCRVICDKGTRLHPNGIVCHETSAARCLRNCYLNNSRNDLSPIPQFASFLYGLYRQHIQRRNQKIRNKTVDLLICPSGDLTELLKVCGYPKTIHIPNMVPSDIYDQQVQWGQLGQPIQKNHQIQQNTQYQKNKRNEKRILFCAGAIREGKGIPFLLSVYRQQDYRHLELHVAGKIEKEKTNAGPDEDIDAIVSLLQSSGAVYVGSLSHEMLIEKLHTAYAVIIPSVFYENYPNIGLEAAAAGCLVCGSRNGGIQEEVFSEALLYDRNSREDLKRVLHTLDTMDENTYRLLLNRQTISLTENNTWSVWYPCIQREIRIAGEKNSNEPERRIRIKKDFKRKEEFPKSRQKVK